MYNILFNKNVEYNIEYTCMISLPHFYPKKYVDMKVFGIKSEVGNLELYDSTARIRCCKAYYMY